MAPRMQKTQKEAGTDKLKPFVFFVQVTRNKPAKIICISHMHLTF